MGIPAELRATRKPHRPGVAPGAWHRFGHPVCTDSGTLFASIDLASHPVPGTDSGTLFASIDLASHPVPGTDSGTLWELLYDNLHCRVTVSSCLQAQRTLP